MKLHIGGKQAKEGWTIFNIQKMDCVDIVGDIRDLSQFQDESLEIIYASHGFRTCQSKRSTRYFTWYSQGIKKRRNFLLLCS